MKFTFVLSLVIAILVAVFALMNGAPVEVNLGFMQFTTSQALVILSSAAIGAIIIYLIDLFAKVKNRFRIKELEKRISALERELLEKNKMLEQKNSVASVPPVEAQPVQTTETTSETKE